ncbi:Transposon Ty3-G Gag-Pol polyprotein [Trichinella spiralis]|uniref:Transposon Ty3-G Gag-Pol polyprotein n=1 Tax=Trichinella spiralis TaxID=6334 RepID=A0ABR3KSZ0_TRISP
MREKTTTKCVTYVGRQTLNSIRRRWSSQNGQQLWQAVFVFYFFFLAYYSTSSTALNPVEVDQFNRRPFTGVKLSLHLNFLLILN